MGRLAVIDNRQRVDNQVRDANRAQACAGLIGHHHFVTRDGVPELQRSGGARDDSLAGTTVMGATDVEPYRRLAESTRVDHGSPRTERFAQNHGCTAMERPERLRVAAHGHRRDDTVCGLLDDLNPHLAVEVTEFDGPGFVRHAATVPIVHQVESRNR